MIAARATVPSRVPSHARGSVRQFSGCCIPELESLQTLTSPEPSASSSGRIHSVGVGVLEVPFTLHAASAKTSAGVSTLHVLNFQPSWP